VGDHALADFFERCVALHDNPRKVAPWVVTEIGRELNERNAGIGDLKVTPEGLVELIKLFEAGMLNNITAKEVFREVVETGDSATAIARRNGKLIEQDSGEIDRAIADALAEFKDGAVADYRAGKQAALGFLVGQVMRKLRGKANPKEVGPRLEAALKNA
jgi:aspartyl-tRNA(Asn)/glutamyl-tRNA(Gln) amidotransferase subunit B